MSNGGDETMRRWLRELEVHLSESRHAVDELKAELKALKKRVKKLEKPKGEDDPTPD